MTSGNVFWGCDEGWKPPRVISTYPTEKRVELKFFAFIIVVIRDQTINQIIIISVRVVGW